MRRLSLALLVVSFVLLSPNVAGQQVCSPQDYGSEDQPDFDCRSPGEEEMVPDLRPHSSIPVPAGRSHTAQWDGAFVDSERLVELGMRIKALRRLRWADRLRMRNQFEVELQHARALAQARLDYATAQRDAYRQQLATANERISDSRPWWRSPTLWLAVGVIVTSGLVAVAAYGLSAVGG